MNPKNPGMGLLLEQAKAATQGLGVQLQSVEARSSGELDAAFAAVTRERAGGIFVPWDGMFIVHLRQIVSLAESARSISRLPRPSASPPSLLAQADRVIE